ncbi:MAG: DNA polymerase IV [Actinobacteria bacterium]|nr:DNA polymerase IV [Actinomycetota bacterium]
MGSDDSGCNILHVDMDAFFAEVELRDRPELRGRPVIIGRENGRGVVTSATYEARAHGVHSAMPMGRALRASPQAVVIEPSMGKYSSASKEVMAILRRVTPRVEQVSIDEAFLDVSGAVRLLGSPTTMAALIRANVKADVDLPCSVGVASVTMVAKIASTLAKPNGVMLVPKAQTVEFLHSLRVQRLWGVGGTTASALAAIGVYTVADLAELPPSTLINAVGKAGAQRLRALAAGEETRGLAMDSVEKSIGSERTFDVDVTDPAELQLQLRREVEVVSRRLRRAELLAVAVSVKVRYADFTTVERSHSLSSATDSSTAIFEAGQRLLTGLVRAGAAVRLVGVRVSKLVAADTVGHQLTLDETTESLTAAEKAMDEVIDRFGSAAVARGSLMGGIGRTGRIGRMDRNI